MARAKTHTKEQLAASAMELFWAKGFSSTSMDEIVRHTGVSRHGIYVDFGGKKGLFLAAFPTYQQSVVTPAFKSVEAAGAGLTALRGYFEQQIALAAELGLPGRGCLVANTMVEPIAADADVALCVEEHLQRLKRGFINALPPLSFAEGRREDLAETMVVFTQGLWSHSRFTRDADELRLLATNFLQLIEAQTTL